MSDSIIGASQVAHAVRETGGWTIKEVNETLDVTNGHLKALNDRIRDFNRSSTSLAIAMLLLTVVNIILIVLSDHAYLKSVFNRLISLIKI